MAALTVPICSIIIPHRNIPQLLCRLLDSIPVDERIQVIIVDDNSDRSVVDFAAFPGVDRPYTEVFFTHEGRGAGYARNIGLEHARGEWLIFADADDLFSESLASLIGKYAEAEADEVIFNARSVMSDDLSAESDRCQRDALFKAWQRGDEVGLRYVNHEPWGRMIRRSLVEEHHLRFATTRYSNDAVFITSVQLRCRTVLVVDEVMYIVTERHDSLTHSIWDATSKPSLTECQDRLSQNFQAYILLRNHGVKGLRMFYWLFVKLYARHYPLRVWAEPFCYLRSEPYYAFLLARNILKAQVMR